MYAIMERASTAATVPAGEYFSLTLIDSFIKHVDRTPATQRTYIINLRQFAAWLQYEQICRPVREDIIAYREYLATEHPAIKLDQTSAQGWSYRTDAAGQPIRTACSSNTIAQYLRSVCQFFKWAAAAGLYPDIAQGVHAPKIRHDTHKKEALTAADVLKIENSINDQAQEKEHAAASAGKDTAGRTQRAGEQGARLKALYMLAVNAGLRTIELSRANVKDLEVINGSAFLFIHGKGHSEADQKKPLAPEVYKAVRDYLDTRAAKATAAAPLFVSTGNRSGGQRIAPTTISRMLKGAMKSAGYDSDRLTAHSLRHTAGTVAQELTNDLYLTQKYMRHANPATTEIYLHTSTEKQEAEIAQALYNKFHGITAAQDQRQQLESILQRMNPEQLAQLAGIAAAIAR